MVVVVVVVVCAGGPGSVTLALDWSTQWPVGHTYMLCQSHITTLECLPMFTEAVLECSTRLSNAF